MGKSLRRNAILAVLLGTALLAGACSNGKVTSGDNAPQGAASGNGTEQAAPPQEERGSISASIYDRGRVPAEEGSYADNRWTRWMNEQSGVDVKWTPIPRAQEFDKYNMLIASGQAPDLITSYDRNMLSRFVSQGVAQPVDEYIEKYSTSYKKYLEEHPELKPYLTFDGKMYAVASMRNTRAQTMIWIRQDWLDKLNLKMPATVDELLDVARAFRDRDPDGNGEKDTIPIAMTLAYDRIVDDWFQARSAEWMIEDGKATQSFFTERYKDSLAFQKLAYDEGLVDKEYVTDRKTWARQKQLWLTGKSGILFGFANTTNEGPNAEFFKSQPNAVVKPVPPIATKYGTNGYQKEAPNFLLTLFNKDMKDPKAAMKFIDWMLDSGWKPLTYGEEGIHYELKNGIPVTKNPEKFAKEVSYAIEYRLVHQEQLSAESLAAQAGDDPNQQKAMQLFGEALAIVAQTAYRQDFPYPPSVPEYTDIASQFKAKWEEIATRTTIGGKSYTPDRAVADIRKEWDALGGKNIEAKVQQWYEQNKESFK
ncbi:extracellular solute-binding protein [Cohnella sp. CFH 77786]|uniref:extracellular solute-binding protein n=1 Tax=Cohnella sp. CFH 77786 TaxID=2662265 RepID=UPI001C609D0F|nr:extracellular solute-binding protein [Cohnella sp. CFH 77786]